MKQKKGTVIVPFSINLNGANDLLSLYQKFFGHEFAVYSELN